ncbi:MAG: hypothetical protein PHI79_02265 [Sulfurovaceae bacterium]|nr:hypothetical protein [Sulfurovaceae bacterium]MDD5548401.1 hypothetical protein [Sulfurovaceae bacterium]
MPKILASIIFLISFGFANDIFIGTLEKDDVGLYLKRCALGSDIYTLKDQAKSTIIKDLEKKYTKLKKPITISFVAEYEECNGKNCLLVDSIDEMTENESCHLLDNL